MRVRAARAPIIDGRDTDDVWRTAPVIEGFRQFDPGEDLDPAFRTEARVTYDARFLYVLVRAFDPHPDSIVRLLSRRDVKTASDQLKIIIDPFHDRRSGVEMAVNPAGVKREEEIKEIAKNAKSHTGRFLKEVLARRPMQAVKGMEAAE